MKYRETTYPNFIGIGAARSGTTWIASHLQKHEKVWLPRRKELHYFSRDKKYLSPSFLSDNKVINRILSVSEHNLRYKKECFKAFARNLLSPNYQQLKWDINYFLRNCNDKWYESLFDYGSHLVRGEITPAYSLLNESDVKHIADLIPNLKIIYIMRNPIDRAWSTIKYHEKRYGKNLTQLNLSDQKKYLSNPSIMARSDYANTLIRWRKHFPESQIFTAYYDEIISHPRNLLKRLSGFLEINYIESAIELSTKINSSSEILAPKEVRVFLNEIYTTKIKEIHELEKNIHTKNWLNGTLI